VYRLKFEFGPLAAKEEIALVVLLDGNVVESYTLSAKSGSKDFEGSTNYITNRVNRQSDYVYILENFITRDVSNVSTLTTATHTLQDGANGGVPAAEKYHNAIDLFSDSESIDLNYTIQTSSSSVGKYWIDNITTVRRDCVAVVGPDRSDVVNINNATANSNVITKRSTMGNTSYAFMVGNYKYQYDKYNDKWRWVSLCGDVAGLMAQAAQNNQPWTSPAGYQNGQIKNINRLAFVSDKPKRDLSYPKQINSIVADSGGFVLLGDKTLLSEPIMFNFFNVMMAFITIEKAIATASKFRLFALNDEDARLNFKNMTIPYLRTVVSTKGIKDFVVLCDETNNPDNIVDQGQFVASIFIKSLTTIQGMNLNFIASPSVEFDEIVAQNT